MTDASMFDPPTNTPAPHGEVTAELIRPQRRGTALVPAISLSAEMAKATLGGVITGLAAFAGSLTATSAGDLASLKTAGIAAGYVAVVYFANSLKNWYAQQETS